MNNQYYYGNQHSKWKPILFGILALIVVIGIGTGLYYFNKTIELYTEEVEETPLMNTYAQQERADYLALKHKKKATIQDIAYAQLEQATGLSGNINHFEEWGLHTGDKFVRYGVLSGDGVPYSSQMKNNQGAGTSLSKFDASDDAYWKKIKDKDFNSIRNKVNTQLPTLSSKDEQVSQIKDAIKKAQQDDIMNAGQRKQNHDKKLTPQDVR